MNVRERQQDNGHMLLEPNRGSIAFVGSLLPARFVVENGAFLNIRKIVVLTEVHKESYSYVARRIPGAVVSRLKGGSLAMGISIAVQLVFARIRRHRVIFFHEAGWPVFDLLVSVLRPEGLFLPRVTMAGYDIAALADMPQPVGLKQKFKQRLYGMFIKRFVLYRTPKDLGIAGENSFLLALRRYPASIRTLKVGRRVVGTSEPHGVRSHEANTSEDVHRVVFIGGAEPVAHEYLQGTYLRLIDMAQTEGYKVFIKDHPLHRLNVPCASCVVIDPAMPIELVQERFAFSIGVASSALLAIGDRKLSILNLLDSMPDHVKRFRRARLLSRPDSDRARIEFVSGLEDIQRILREYRSKASPVGCSTVGASSASDSQESR